MSASEVSSKATTALVTGILSILCCAPLGIWAIIAAGQAQSLADASGEGHDQLGKATAGKVCGFIGLGLWALGIIAQVVLNMGGG